MMPTHDHSAHDNAPGAVTAKMSRRSKWVFGGFAAIALVLLAFEHRVHLAGWLPWLILLACPLMHLFMHGGHGHAGHGATSDSGDEK